MISKFQYIYLFSVQDNEGLTIPSNEKSGTLESNKIVSTELKMEDVVLLRVHGITEAGMEIFL